MKIFIRVDGGKSIGMGHVMRMIVLGKELSKNNQVIFLCKKDDGKYDAGIQKIKEYNFEVIEIKHRKTKEYMKDIETIIKIQKHENAHILITDSYEVNEDYFNILQPYFKLTGYVDDINKCYMNVDFIINQNINAKKLDYSKTTKAEATLFLGLEYCMIREEFKIASKEKKEKDSVEDILLTLGGMDDSNNTMRILEKLKSLKQRIHVVLGNAFEENVINEVYNFSQKYKNIYPYKNANISELMKKCDIAISACGSTIYELCVMGLPTIGVIIAENQIGIAELMRKDKLILDNIYMKDLIEERMLYLVKLLINDEKLRHQMKKNVKDVVDLYGVERLEQNIEKLIKAHERK